ncbi:phospholipase D family protein [Nocardiopsis sp. FR26]|uniref:phospholipase D family protein n=1 Tax=Nocardiopsis sp. FR26 TaxID=2605987 RepID=UPI00135BCDEA|nr:phospholipase D family protein [Nocardiopsis sp. FR26]
MTEPARIWGQIKDLLKGAHEQVTVVAPFIKQDVLAAVLSAVPTSVAEIRCTTRWMPDEVAAGVSDPEIIELAAADDRLSIALCPSLHAKLYVADGHSLVGSANLTGKATGRVTNANIEILIETPKTHPEVQRVLTEIESRAIEATPHMAVMVRNQAELLKQQGPPAPDQCREEVQQGWYPATRRPESVYEYYCGKGQFGKSVETDILQDLALLRVPAGLSKVEFSAWVESCLREIPVLESLMSGDRLSNVELENALQEENGMTSEQAKRSAETVAAWLRHFGRFYTEIGTWEIRHGQELP